MLTRQGASAVEELVVTWINWSLTDPPIRCPIAGPYPFGPAASGLRLGPTPAAALVGATALRHRRTPSAPAEWSASPPLKRGYRRRRDQCREGADRVRME